MSKTQALWRAVRAIAISTPRAIPHQRLLSPAAYAVRHKSTISKLLDQKDSHDAATTGGQPGESGDHEGQFARIDESVRVEHPEDKDLPSSAPVQGRGGKQHKLTLPSFSLEGRVGIVTGGARGLGLVMSQAFVLSGADVAIVDLNSTLSAVLSCFVHIY